MRGPCPACAPRLPRASPRDCCPLRTQLLHVPCPPRCPSASPLSRSPASLFPHTAGTWLGGVGSAGGGGHALRVHRDFSVRHPVPADYVWCVRAQRLAEVIVPLARCPPTPLVPHRLCSFVCGARGPGALVWGAHGAPTCGTLLSPSSLCQLAPLAPLPPVAFLFHTALPRLPLHIPYISMCPATA